jgi:hypothetical protein
VMATTAESSEFFMAAPLLWLTSIYEDHSAYSSINSAIEGT